MFRCIAAAIAFASVACNQQSSDRVLPAPVETPAAPTSAQKAEREKWIDLPTEQWPQLVLTNDAVFEGHAPLDGASCFLIQDPNSGQVLFATARHLLSQAGGVVPRIDIAKMDSIKYVWKAHPRTQAERSIRVGRPELAAFDVALFSLLDPVNALPAQPLRVRQTPVTLGETVFLIGCPYEAGCRQNVYRGKVNQIGDTPYIEYTFEPSAELRGFSGGPIIDANGLAVGGFALKGRSEIPKNLGGAYLLAPAFARKNDTRLGIRLTAVAAEQFRSIVKESKHSPTTVLRVSWSEGKTNLDLDPAPEPTDIRWESHGVAIVTDVKSFPYLQAAVVDYQNTPAAKGFFVDHAFWFRREAQSSTDPN